MQRARVAVIDITYLCPARYVILPLQDLLGTGAESRMNMPGTLGMQNWSYRYPRAALTDKFAEKILKSVKESNR